MIYICSLLYIFTTTISQTFGVEQKSTDDVQKFLHASVSDYELISVEHSIDKRDTNKLSIKANINGTDREFVLQSTKGYFAGKDTKVWLAKREANKFVYSLQKEIMDQVNNTFYHDEKTKSIISHTVNKRGISEFNGVIDSNKVILSISNFIRKRRDLIPEEFHKYENDNIDNYHIIYKRASDSVKEVPNHNLNKSNKRIENLNLKKPDTVYPEILVYVDKTFFEYFDNDIVKTVAYTLTLWNGADLNFRDIKNPSVRLSIVGIVICQDQSKSFNPFVIDDSTLSTFGQFMYNEDQFKFREDYDIAVLMGADPKFESGAKGEGLMGGACSENVQQKVIESAMVLLDNTKLSGIFTAAHELAHLFNVPHDGEQGSEECDFTEGYLMSHLRFDSYQFYFSPCSEKLMSSFLSQERANCLYNNPAVTRNDKQILRILPGKYMTIDEQCQKRGFLKADKIIPNICVTIECMKESDSFTVSVAALEGTPCDVGKFCLRGECVKVEFDKADNKDSKILFPPLYQLSVVNKSVEEQCKDDGITNIQTSFFDDCQYYCKFANSDGEMWVHYGTAQDGTLCDDNGYCRYGKCVDDHDGLVVKKVIYTVSSHTTNSTESNTTLDELLSTSDDTITSDSVKSFTDFNTTISTLYTSSSDGTTTPLVETTTRDTINNSDGTTIHENVTSFNHLKTTSSSTTSFDGVTVPLDGITTKNSIANVTRTAD